MKTHGYWISVSALGLALGCDPGTVGTGTGDGTSTGGAEAGTTAADGHGETPTPDDGDDGNGDTDEGITDEGDSEAGDTGPASSGSSSGTAGESDSGESDSGESDAGESDAGESDTGETDSGETDGGESGNGESGGQTFQITGSVVADVAPGGDGIGTLYVGLTVSGDCFDGSSAYTDVIANADLSEIGNAIPFSLTVPTVEASGSGWLLQVFLDDNENAMFESPDAGDMTRFPTGFEEEAGCFDLPALNGDDIAGQIVELDHIVP